MFGGVEHLEHAERPVDERDLPEPDRSGVGTHSIRPAVVIDLEDLRRDQERRVGPAVSDQTVIGVHAGDLEKRLHLLGGVVVEPFQDVVGSVDRIRPPARPLGLDLSPIGLNPEHAAG